MFDNKAPTLIACRSAKPPGGSAICIATRALPDDDTAVDLAGVESQIYIYIYR